MKQESLLLYLGSFNKVGYKIASGLAEGRGLMIYEFNKQSHTISEKFKPLLVNNVSNMCVNDAKNILYTTSEMMTTEESLITVFQIEPISGQLEKIQEIEVKGILPCWVSLDKKGEYLFTANYESGNYSMFPVNADGTLSALSYQFESKMSGKGFIENRQDKPHPHSMITDGQNKFIFAADLAVDRIYRFKLDSDKDCLEEDGFIQLNKGSGPRSLGFHSSGKYFYVACELSCVLAAYKYDAQSGEIEHINSCPMIPASFTEDNISAELQIHPDGKFIYVTNRGHDSISCFTVDEITGELSMNYNIPTGGKTPRSFRIDSKGDFLFLANQHGDNLRVFEINRSTGQLNEIQRTHVNSVVAINSIEF